MTTSMLTAAAALVLLVAPAPSPKMKPGTKGPTKHPGAMQVNKKALNNKSVTKKPTKKPTKTKSKAKPTGKTTTLSAPGNNIPTPAQPTFKKMLSPQSLAKAAKKKKIVPTGGPSAATTLATLTAANARQGDFTIDFRCAFVSTATRSGPEGYASWPNHVLEYCRDSRRYYDPGVEVTFPVQAGRAYSVDCNSAASTRFKIKHKVGDDAWSAESTVSTRNPTDFVLSSRNGTASVRIEFDPPHNHILTQHIRRCRVSRIG